MLPDLLALTPVTTEFCEKRFVALVRVAKALLQRGPCCSNAAVKRRMTMCCFAWGMRSDMVLGGGGVGVWMRDRVAMWVGFSPVPRWRVSVVVGIAGEMTGYCFFGFT